MPMIIGGAVGPQATNAGDGSNVDVRQGKTGEMVVGQLHGRFYEQVARGAVFSIGSGATALSANTITLTATSTPIVGVWNPSTSGTNLVILQGAAQVYINTLTTPVGSGPLVWASSVGNTAISTGSAPYNRKIMALSGSVAKGFAGGVALTGLTNNMVVFESADISNTTIVTHGTVTAVTGQSSFGGVHYFDGGLIVPPGGVLALYNTTSTTTCSVASRLMWEEVLV
jgi:hypothetical protein